MFQQEFQSLCLEISLQQFACSLIQLGFHQPFGQMDNGDVHSLQLQAFRGFQPKQTAADDDSFLVLACGFHHFSRIIDGSKGDYAVFLRTGNR